MLRLPISASSRALLTSSTTPQASAAIPSTSRSLSRVLSRTQQCCNRRALTSAAARPFSTTLVSGDAAGAATTSDQQARNQHAVSNPTLANIEKRWGEMPPQEQAELWMALRDRMTVDWHQMTMQEKRASYWIAFGPHGPRAGPPPGESWEVLKTVIIYTAGSIGVFFAIRQFAREPPKTMTKEWQEMSNEYLKGQKAEPITGLSSEGYEGEGMVQSKPGLAKYEQEDDE